MVATLLFRSIYGENRTRVICYPCAFCSYERSLCDFQSRSRGSGLGRGGILPFGKVWGSNRPFNATFAGLALPPPPGDAVPPPSLSRALAFIHLSFQRSNAAVCFGSVYFSYPVAREPALVPRRLILRRSQPPPCYLADTVAAGECAFCELACVVPTSQMITCPQLTYRPFYFAVPDSPSPYPLARRPMAPKPKLCNCTRYCMTSGCRAQSRQQMNRPRPASYGVNFVNSQPPSLCLKRRCPNGLFVCYKHFSMLHSHQPTTFESVRMLLGFSATTCCLSSIIFDKFSDKHLNLINPNPRALELLLLRLSAMPPVRQYSAIRTFGRKLSLSYTAVPIYRLLV
ncbi:hypothetical protein BJ912DRAFT_457597 [Pholiota molesta]|nr:hypothetical protein BJ912DRAFT_457597 [Pholiota molesta]